MDAHAAIQDLKRVAGELGRVPTRDEFLSLGQVTRDHFERLFKGWAPYVAAAGLKPHRNRAKKLSDADCFGADIRATLTKQSDPEPLLPQKSQIRRTLVIGDAHFPFVSELALMAIYAFVDALPLSQKPEVIVQVGDLYDMYSHAKFPRSRNIYNPREEIELGYEMAAQMWATLKRLAPSADCHQILGNHDVRPQKRVIEQYPEGEIFFSIDKWFQFPGVTTHMDPRRPLDLGYAAFIHGHRSRSQDHWLDLPGANIVHGHSHKGGIVYRRYGQETKFVMDVAFIGDPEAKVFGYMPIKTLSMIMLFGWIDSNGPRLISV